MSKVYSPRHANQFRPVHYYGAISSLDLYMQVSCSSHVHWIFIIDLDIHVMFTVSFMSSLLFITVRNLWFGPIMFNNFHVVRALGNFHPCWIRKLGFIFPWIATLALSHRLRRTSPISHLAIESILATVSSDLRCIAPAPRRHRETFSGFSGTAVRAL